MLKGLGLVVLAAAVGVGAGALTWARPMPAPKELLDDLASTRELIRQGEKDVTGSEGLIGVQAALRLATLRSTEVMLEQRRLAWLRGINIRYDDTRPAGVVPEAERRRIEAEIATAEADILQAKTEAARYSGGLILVMLQVREATGRATVAQLHQQLALARNGVSIPQMMTAPRATPTPPGRTTTDMDALR